MAMTMTGKEIRTLRQRLGWSVAEMARRMGCGTELIQTWETGLSAPDQDANNQLRYLQSHCERCSDETLAKPQVEKKMQAERISQLTHRDLLKDH